MFTKFILNSISNISILKDILLLCDKIHSNSFIGEIVYFNNNLSYKGLVFEMSLKNILILLLNCNHRNVYSIICSRETIKIKVGFHVLGNTITLFGNKNKRYYSTRVLDSTEWVFTFDYIDLELNNKLDSNQIELFVKEESNIYSFLENSILESLLQVLKTDYLKDEDIDVNLWQYKKKNDYGFYSFFYDNRDYNLYDFKNFNIYAYFFYKKKINFSINNCLYEVYCVYYLHSDYSFDGPSEVMYSCIFMYKNSSNDSFAYNENVNSILFDLLMNRSEKLDESQRDPFFRQNLLEAISVLVEHNMEWVDRKFISNKLVTKLKTNISSKRHYCLVNNNKYLFKNNKFFFSTNFLFFTKVSGNSVFFNYKKVNHLFIQT